MHTTTTMLVAVAVPLGNQDPVEYVAEFGQKFSMDPDSDNFLNGYIGDEAYTDDEEDDNESDDL